MVKIPPSEFLRLSGLTSEELLLLLELGKLPAAFSNDQRLELDITNTTLKDLITALTNEEQKKLTPNPLFEERLAQSIIPEIEEIFAQSMRLALQILESEEKKGLVDTDSYRHKG